MFHTFLVASSTTSISRFMPLYHKESFTAKKPLKLQVFLVTSLVYIYEVFDFEFFQNNL